MAIDMDAPLQDAIQGQPTLSVPADTAPDELELILEQFRRDQETTLAAPVLPVESEELGPLPTPPQEEETPSTANTAPSSPISEPDNLFLHTPKEPIEADSPFTHPPKQSTEDTGTFQKLIGRLENGIHKGFKANKVESYVDKMDDPKGPQTPTIAYGHKLTKGEMAAGKITLNNGTELELTKIGDNKYSIDRKHIDILLANDIEVAEDEARAYAGALKVDFDDLPHLERLLLVEAMFNAGRTKVNTWKNTAHYLKTGNLEQFKAHILQRKDKARIGKIKTAYNIETEKPINKPKES